MILLFILYTNFNLRCELFPTLIPNFLWEIYYVQSINSVRSKKKIKIMMPMTSPIKIFIWVHIMDGAEFNCSSIIYVLAFSFLFLWRFLQTGPELRDIYLASGALLPNILNTNLEGTQNKRWVLDEVFLFSIIGPITTIRWMLY